MKNSSRLQFKYKYTYPSKLTINRAVRPSSVSKIVSFKGTWYNAHMQQKSELFYTLKWAFQHLEIVNYVWTSRKLLFFEGRHCKLKKSERTRTKKIIKMTRKFNILLLNAFLHDHLKKVVWDCSKNFRKFIQFCF